MNGMPVYTHKKRKHYRKHKIVNYRSKFCVTQTDKTEWGYQFSFGTGVFWNILIKYCHYWYSSILWIYRGGVASRGEKKKKSVTNLSEISHCDLILRILYFVAEGYNTNPKLYIVVSALQLRMANRNKVHPNFPSFMGLIIVTSAHTKIQQVIAEFRKEGHKLMGLLGVEPQHIPCWWLPMMGFHSLRAIPLELAASRYININLFSNYRQKLKFVYWIENSCIKRDIIASAQILCIFL